jgi:DNA-directed RNA polymerase subunit RPC12/RpoP
MNNNYCKMLYEKKREEEIRQFINTKKKITGNENRGITSWGVSGKNHYKCYSCGATSIEDEPQVHYNNYPDCSHKPFVKIY